MQPLLRMGFELKPDRARVRYPPWATQLNRYNKYWGRFDHAGFVQVRAIGRPGAGFAMAV